MQPSAAPPSSAWPLPGRSRTHRRAAPPPLLLLLPPPLFFLALFQALWVVVGGEQRALAADSNCRQLKAMDTVQSLESACYCYIPSRTIHLKNIWSTLQVKISSAEVFKVVFLSEERNCHNSETLLAFFNCIIKNIWQSGVSNETIMSLDSYGEGTCFGVQFEKKKVSYTVEAQQNMLDKKLLLLFVAGSLLFHFAYNLSRSLVFFYSAGVTFGIVATLVFLLVMLKRFIPKMSFLNKTTPSAAEPLFVCSATFIDGLADTARRFQAWREMKQLWRKNVIMFIIMRLLYCKQRKGLTLFVCLGVILRFEQLSTFWVLMSGCWFSTLYFFYTFKEDFKQLWYDHTHYVLGYVLLVGLLSFALCYKHGPLSSERSMDVLMWTLQFNGLVLIYFGLAIPHVAFAVIFVVLGSKFLHYPLRIVCCVHRKANRFFRSEEPEIRLLTEDEYREQGEAETVKALEELRGFCSSPKFPSWLAVVKLQSPQKFAHFVLGSPHVSPEETTLHEEEFGIGGTLLERQLFSTETQSEMGPQTGPFPEEGNPEEEEPGRHRTHWHFQSRDVL